MIQSETVLVPVFQNRNFTPQVMSPSLTFTVGRMSRNALGGPKRAEISAQGENVQLAQFLNSLREPVEIYDDAGRLAWWGLVYDFGLDTEKQEVKLYCDGWWETLSWRTYLNSGTASVATTAQIQAIVTNMGEFITGVDVENASGISSLETREGDRTGLEEIEDLLRAGTTNNRRLLSEVTQLRRLRIWEEPLPAANDLVLEGRVKIGAGLDSMVNKAWALGSAPGESYRHNTATSTDAESASEYGTKSQPLTLSAASETQANAYRDAEIARRRYPIPTIDVNGESGKISTYAGVEVPGYLVPAGIWLRIKDILPPSADTSRLADMSRIFVEEIEWSRTGGIRITPRDVPGRYGEEG